MEHALPKHEHIDLSSLPVACVEAATVGGHAPSLLPADRKFKLVWNDEFDGTALDETKWRYRTNFWGRNAHWFAKPGDGCVEVADGTVRLKIKKLPNGQFISPQLQTGELMWDFPTVENPTGFWPLGKRDKPKFVHRYGYYECRCRLQQLPGWWSAFWMQTEMQGTCLDARYAGIEQDIMESFEPGNVIISSFHYDGYGPDRKHFYIPAEFADGPKVNDRLSIDLDKTVFHTFGLLWEPDGYSVFIDGRLRGRNSTIVSQVPEFLLISTECKWYRNNHMTGEGLPELEDAAAAGDDFVVDYVRVYDIAE